MIAVLGAGAFGTALAISLARDGRAVTLWARSPDHAADMAASRQNSARLPGAEFPASLSVTAKTGDIAGAGTILLAVPTQTLGQLLGSFKEALSSKTLVAACKGIDLTTGLGPAHTITQTVSGAIPAILSGPSFAVDIAAGLPTALTLAAPDTETATRLQARLSTANLRLYRSTDITGAEIGGALKNVIAIACGIAMGAGLGESARAALMTRGYAEMVRFALSRGAKPETLAGLSGFGDLALTCTSAKSRNYAYGLQLGVDGRATTTATTEGIATARAVAALARAEALDMPLTLTMAAVLDDDMTVADAVAALMTRPLKPE